MRLSFIVSHPIQYYVPIYRELAVRDDIEIKVFYTWRDARVTRDQKFQCDFAWDLPLTDGYEFEVVCNTAPDPGTHHHAGLRNPDLVRRVLSWRPDAVHLTGYNYHSHLRAMRTLSRMGVPVIFRGDSHLLDPRGAWWKWQLKRQVLRWVYRWPAAFACVGQANRDYYRAFGVAEEKLFHVPHTIEVERFSEPDAELEEKALRWRRQLGVPDEHRVVLYAAKFERRKRPLELLESFRRADLQDTTLLFVGSGELEQELKQRAEKCDLTKLESARRVIFLPFQNQSAMPVVYRLGDFLVLPSGYAETWGLAVNEAQACGRPAVVSDCVGCARDILEEGTKGLTFKTDDWNDLQSCLEQMLHIDWKSRRPRIRASARAFATVEGVEALVDCCSAWADPRGLQRSR
jgi:glycosyltransferase involved in cell wall biosynthesis